MKIDNGAAQQAYASAAYRSAAGSKARAVTPASTQSSDVEAAKAPAHDRAEISAQSRLRAQALDAVRATPDARTHLVAQLRAQISAGSYQIDDTTLAAHIARRGDMAS